VNCQKIGEKKFYINNIKGFMNPLPQYSNVFHPVILKGKLIVYEKAIIFEDERL